MKNHKKPYRKPSMKSESVLETSTLACGKCTTGGPTGSQTQACKQAKKLS